MLVNERMYTPLLKTLGEVKRRGLGTKPPKNYGNRTLYFGIECIFQYLSATSFDSSGQLFARHNTLGR